MVSRKGDHSKGAKVMAREEDKLRGSEYAPLGPVRVTSGNPLADAIRRIVILEAQVKSLQMAAPKGIPSVQTQPCRSGCECLRCGGNKKP